MCDTLARKFWSAIADVRSPRGRRLALWTVSSIASVVRVIFPALEVVGDSCCIVYLLTLGPRARSEVPRNHRVKWNTAAVDDKDYSGNGEAPDLRTPVR